MVFVDAILDWAILTTKLWENGRRFVSDFALRVAGQNAVYGDAGPPKWDENP